MTDVSLCLINYNGAEHLPATLEAIDAQQWRFAELILVDNASTDGSAALLQRYQAEQCETRCLLQLPHNGGPGAARNAGFASARCSLILFIDNDVRLLPGCVAALVKCIKMSTNTLAVAPRVLYEDSQIIQYDSADCHFLGLMATRNAGQHHSAATVARARTTSLVTACFLLDRRCWAETTLFYDLPGFNLEDHDFGVRAILTGAELYVEPAAIVRHGSGTQGLSYRPGDTPNHTRLLSLVVNRWLIIARCFQRRTLLLLAPALVLFELLQFAWLVSQGRYGVWREAVGIFRSRWHQSRQARQKIQAARRVGDRQLLQDTPLPLTEAVTARRWVRVLVSSVDLLLRSYFRLVRRFI